MANLELDLFLCRTDNFGVLVHDPETGATASIDAPEEQPILGALKRRGWRNKPIVLVNYSPTICLNPQEIVCDTGGDRRWSTKELRWWIRSILKSNNAERPGGRQSA